MAKFLCRYDKSVNDWASADDPYAPMIDEYARAIAVAIVAIETYNRPALWRLAKETLFSATAWASPRVARMTLGPAQMSHPFFDHEIAPLAPEAPFPASIATVAGARHLLESWAAARLANAAPSSPEAFTRTLVEIVDAYHGSDDATYRAVALYIAVDRCRPFIRLRRASEF